MATQGPNPLPPTTILSTTSISQSAAHDFLAAYLDRANTDPALQPNAGISEHGPVSRTTASAPNLILHNLKRVQAGLAGEVLGRDLAVAKLNAEQDGDGQVDGAGAGENNEGWEDAQKWQQADEEEAPMEVEEGAGDEADAGGIDKEERKRKKKERRLAEKKAKSKGADA